MARTQLSGVRGKNRIAIQVARLKILVRPSYQ